MRKFFLFLFCLILITHYALRITLPAHAFSLQPSSVDISLQPGGTYEANVHVTNDENIERPYYISIQKFFPKGESGQQDFLPLSDTSGLPSWTFVSAPAVILKPGESRAIPFIIRTPLDAKAGGYYAAIFFSTEPPLQKPTGKILAGARVGTLIFLTIQGELTQKLSFTDFSVEPNFNTHLPVLFRTRLENTGNIHTIPAGEIIIKNYFGSEVARLPLNPLEARMLPNSARAFSVPWQIIPPQSGSGFWHEVHEEWRNFALGRYTAQMTVNGISETPTQSFVVWPWHLLLVMLIALLIIIVCLRLYRRWVLHRAVVKS